ncbi:hypothetical protein LVD17_05275 [Fulvivirga ulvae]|uniref:hypothetical protein n=1 Tax=Fulvivirga ulvae TaxID=2904245 RepID=UPI001F2FC962|nr:hypothetical protein [Fulvivirga ulvae]UII33234.1 hypothetical protein LVD17_05275 [Fulvivirga ulvae]
MKEEKGNIDLNKIPKKDLYQAPEGYFEALPDNILQRIDEEENGKERKFGVQVNWKMIGYAAAASIVLLVSVLIGFQHPKDDTVSAADLLSEVPTADLVLYLQYSEIDTYEIIEATDIEDLADPLVGAGDLTDPQLDDADMELLYEQYGISPDENLQMF